MGVRLGRGGMSQVWRATTVSERPVAVKFTRPDVVCRSMARELIRREFAFLNELPHRGVISPLRLIEVEQEFGFVMEYVGGGDLVSLAGSHPRHWVPVAAQLARALVYIHGAGIVHRDIKARNVLLRAGDEPCLIDFALAAEIGEQAPRGGGTPAYQGANQQLGKAPAVTDDVYSFAALIYELWTGTLPFGTNPTLEKLGDPLEFPQNKGVRGLQALANLLSDTLEGRNSVAQGGITPFLDALELVVTE